MRGLFVSFSQSADLGAKRGETEAHTCWNLGGGSGGVFSCSPFTLERGTRWGGNTSPPPCSDDSIESSPPKKKSWITKKVLLHEDIDLAHANLMPSSVFIYLSY
jgi:hypothetical protein